MSFFDLNNLESLFTNFGGFNSVSNKQLPQGFVESNIDLLLNQARKFDSVRQNRIFDLIGVEGDPWFSKRYEKNQRKILKKLSDLQTSSAIVNTVVAQADAAGFLNYMPQQVKDILLKYQQITDTSVNFLVNYNQHIFFSQIATAFFGDLKFQLGEKTISLNDIILFSERFYKNFEDWSLKPNNSIRKVLELQLMNFLPEEYSSIVNALHYIDLLQSIFGSDSQDFNTYKNLFSAYSDDISSVYVADCVSDSSVYTNATLDFSDPLGINVQTFLEKEINEHLSQNVIPFFIEKILSEGNLTVSDEQKEQLILATKTGTENLLTTAFDSNVALPSISDSVEAIQIATYLSVRNSIIDALDMLSADILSNAGIAVPTKNRFDYLANLKKNLAANQKNLSSQSYKYLDKI